MTTRACPWCGKNNLRITNVMCSNQTIYWNDSACGYREITGYGPDHRVLKTLPPVPPLPCHQKEKVRKTGSEQTNLGRIAA